jgi:uncharacterized protein (DUF1778 family)
MSISIIINKLSAYVNLPVFPIDTTGKLPYSWREVEREAEMAVALRAERVEIRMTPEQKENIERAASLRGTSVTDFILNEVQPAATATIEEFELLELRNEDRRVFVEALLNPPQPNEAMKAAVARHKQMGL